MSEFVPACYHAFSLYIKYVHPYVTATNLPFLYIERANAWGEQILSAIARIRKELVEKVPFTK